jgi:carbonic anhydrase
MKKLIQGLREFQSNYFVSNQDLFEQLGEGQSPAVLFITCSDSRIVPSIMVNADPGDLFVIRNAGNIVPAFGAANGGEGASIEYAIHALNITQIIICGHNHCGAMKGLLKLNSLQEDMPLVYDWLKHTDATRRLLKENYGDYEGEELLDIAVAENILTQMENLKTYPVVRSRMHQGTLNIYGWIYEIETGEILAYNPATNSFAPPQSLLYPEDKPEEIRPGQYVKTDAPPVKPIEPPKTQSYADSIGAGSWVSPAQSDRIFQGSKR